MINKNEWIEYVAIHAPVTLYEAESLYALSMVPNITKEFIAKMLCEYGGDVRFFSKIITVGMNEYNKDSINLSDLTFNDIYRKYKMFIEVKNMSAYRYLNCDKCNEYIHLGKVGGSDFEVDFKTFEQFLDKHAEYKGCSLSALSDACESQYYCKVMDGTEFKNDEYIIGYAGEDIKEGGVICQHADDKWYNKKTKCTEICADPDLILDKQPKKAQWDRINKCTKKDEFICR